MRAVIAAILLVLLGACSAERWNAWVSTPQERAFAGQMVQTIQAGDMRRLVAVSDLETMADFTPRILAQVRVLLPEGPARLMTVSANSVTVNGETRTFKAFNYELGAGSHWAILQILLRTEGDRPLLAGIHVVQADRSPTAAHAFSLRGKSAVHYLWLAAMLAAVATSVTSFVLILRTRGLRLKWLWAVGSLLGFIGFQLNWTTGEWGIWALSIHLLGAGATQNGPLLPWVMTFAIPVVAIAFLAARALGFVGASKPAAQLETGTP